MQYRTLITGIAIATATLGVAGAPVPASGDDVRTAGSHIECCVYHRGIGWLCCTPPMITWTGPAPTGGGRA